MLTARFALKSTFGLEKHIYFFFFAEWQHSFNKRRKGEDYPCGFPRDGKRGGTVLLPAL